MSRRDLFGPRLTVSLPARLAPFRWTMGATGGLVTASVLTSATGFVFWWIAARQYPPAAVGLAGAAVSAMLLLSQISVFGLGTALAGVLHREPRAASLAATAMMATGLVGLLLGLTFGVLAPLVSSELRPIIVTPLALAIFVAGVGVTALTAVLDQVLVSMSRQLLQLARNVIFGFGRLPILVLAAALAIGIVFLMEKLDGSYHSLGELQSDSEIPVLAAIPEIITAHDRKRRWGRLLLGFSGTVLLLVATSAASYKICENNHWIVGMLMR